MSLENRSHGYEFTVQEQDNIFPNGLEVDNINYSENRGIVRYRSKRNKEFYLHPSMWKKPVREEIFVVKSGEMPPENSYVEVTVSETATALLSDHVPKNTMDFKTTKVKFITGWEFRDVKELRRNPLTTPELFMDHIALPFRGKKLDFERTVLGITTYLTSNPQFLDFEKGGSNVLFFGNTSEIERTKVLNTLTSVIPPELRSTRSRYFYTSLEKDQVVNPVNSIEVSPAYLNSEKIPIHLPVYMDLSIKNKTSYNADFKHYVPMLTAYLLDGLMFEPEIPDSLDKKIQDNIQDIFDTVTCHNTLPYHQNIGSSLAKISSGRARFNRELTVSKEDLEKSTELITESFNDAVRYMKFGYDIDKVYPRSNNQNKVLKIIEEISSTGVNVLVTEVKKKSNLIDTDFEEALKKLYDSCYIYFPKKGIIKLVEF